MKNPLTHLVRWLDLCGVDGRPSYGKLMGIAVFVGGSVGNLPSTLGVALLAFGLGRAAFIAFLARGSFSASDSSVRTTTTIRHIHDPGA